MLNLLVLSEQFQSENTYTDGNDECVKDSSRRVIDS